jgi:hypothetical protein
MYGVLRDNDKRQKILRGYVGGQNTLSSTGLLSQSNIEKKQLRNPFPELPLEEGLDISYSPLEKTQKKLDPYGYKLDTDLSTKENKVFYNPYNNRVVYSVAGTNPYSARDLGTDAYLAFLGQSGLKATNRYKEAEATLEKVRDKYKKAKKTLIGHSLGSQIINTFDKRPNENVKGFGTGSGLFSAPQTGEFYRTIYDPFSFTSKDKLIPSYIPEKKGNLRGKEKVDYPQGVFPSHSYENLKGRNVFV